MLNDFLRLKEEASLFAAAEGDGAAAYGDLDGSEDENYRAAGACGGKEGGGGARGRGQGGL